MAEPFQQHQGFEGFPTWEAKPQEQATQTDVDLALVAVSRALEANGEHGVLAPRIEATEGATASIEINSASANIRAHREAYKSQYGLAA
jgi:hypothetical protein